MLVPCRPGASPGRPGAARRHPAAGAQPRIDVELGVSPVALDLLLGHLATLGIVERTPTGYRTTEFGAHLRAGGFTNLLLDMNTAAGRAELACVELAHSVTTGEAACPRRYGQPRTAWSSTR